MKVLAFKISNLYFGVESDYVEGITGAPSGIHFCCARPKSNFRGDVTVKNENLDVFCLTEKLGLACSGRVHSHQVLVINNGNYRYGVLVDEVNTEVEIIDTTNIEATEVLGDHCTSHIKGMVNHHGKVLTILDMNYLISIEELVESA